MTIDIELVKRYFLLFSDLPDSDAERWGIVCRNAAVFVKRSLNGDADIQENQERLCVAAAGCAYADYLLLDGSRGLSDEVRIGDIALKNKSPSGHVPGKAEAWELKDYFMGQISDLVKNNNSVFFAIGEDASS